jgi:hypothetical protein
VKGSSQLWVNWVRKGLVDGKEQCAAMTVESSRRLKAVNTGALERELEGQEMVVVVLLLLLRDPYAETDIRAGHGPP